MEGMDRCPRCDKLIWTDDGRHVGGGRNCDITETRASDFILLGYDTRPIEKKCAELDDETR